VQAAVVKLYFVQLVEDRAASSGAGYCCENITEPGQTISRQVLHTLKNNKLYA
jgi:hypothetical protein